MEHPVSITFRGFESTDALKQAVTRRTDKLDKFYNKIESCDVALEAPHRHRRSGNIYRVRVRLTVPGDEIVVARDPLEHASHEDLYLAINDTFKEVERKLEDYVRRRRRR